jgi:hypothetical protein
MTRLDSISNKKRNSVEFASTNSPPSTTIDGNNRTGSEVDTISRKPSIFTVEKLNERYQLNEDFDDSPIGGTWNYIKKYYKPTPAFFKRQLFKRIPFLDWIRHYNIKEWLMADIVSGLTIGIVHIPQGKKVMIFRSKFSRKFF